MREIDFSNENSPPNGYGRLQTIGPPNGTAPLQGYFHLTPSPRSVYGGHDIYDDNMYSCTSLPQDGLRPSSVSFSMSPVLAGVDPITFEMGALNTNIDQNWMAFF
jgi:hypothetical protein